MKRASRFGLAGMANTALGFGIIVSLEIGLGVQRHLANAIGYCGGMLLGYVLHRNFVFRSKASSRTKMIQYAVAVAGAFGLNQLILWVTGAIFGDSAFGRLAAQLMAIASYTVSLFVILSTWVFRPAKTPA